MLDEIDEQVGLIWPWSNKFHRILKLAMPHPFKGELLYGGVDYSGDGKRFKYDVVTMVLVDIPNSRRWGIERQLVREKFLKDNRRMSFKGLNDALKRRALVPFLDAANY